MSASIGQRPRGRQRVSFLATHPPAPPAVCPCLLLLPLPRNWLDCCILWVRSLSLLVSAALAEAASDSAPEADDVTVFDPTARDKETLAKAVAADLKAVGLGLSF